MLKLGLGSLLLSCYVCVASAASDQNPATIPETDLVGFSNYSPAVQRGLRLLLTLTRMNLHYQYGSANPKLGGMDCSGTIYYVLNTIGIKNVPRSSDWQYEWISRQGHAHLVSDTAQSIDSQEFADLHPGDLLFWAGTYAIQRDINITHVMMYLGKNQAGKPLMAGASNGRTYQGRKIYGVSVFDFKVPDTDGHFVGYGCVPGLNC